MKKIIISCLLLILILSGVYYLSQNNDKEIKDENTTTSDDKLLKVLNSEKTFIDENNNEVLLKDYKVVDDVLAVPNKYTFIDLDNDNVNELVIYLTTDYGAYIILNIQNNNIYGYMIGIRSFESLKKDGTFIGSNSAFSQNYSKITFDKSNYNIINEATFDERDNIYTINNKEVSKEEIDNYINNWNQKKDVDWIEFKK